MQKEIISFIISYQNEIICEIFVLLKRNYKLRPEMIVPLKMELDTLQYCDHAMHKHIHEACRSSEYLI